MTNQPTTTLHHDVSETPFTDLNLFVVSGRLAAAAQVNDFTDFQKGDVVNVRFLLTVRSNHPRRRVDVLPVVVWSPDDETLAALSAAAPGTRIWASGSVQRRFTDTGTGRTSRLEMVANAVAVSRTDEDDA